MQWLAGHLITKCRRRGGLLLQPRTQNVAMSFQHHSVLLRGRSWGLSRVQHWRSYVEPEPGDPPPNRHLFILLLLPHPARAAAVCVRDLMGELAFVAFLL